MVKKQVVVVGGGTGTHTVLRGLMQYTAELEIAAIVSMADSGGSTGRLRDEFGQLPTGDVRNALTALAAKDDEHEALLRQLFLYRFSRGEGLYGHNFGNLFLTVLTDILGSEVAAIAAASRILRVSGRVVPVTTDDAHLHAVYADGTILTSEHEIDEWTGRTAPDTRIVDLSLSPKAELHTEAAALLAAADLIVLGPGDLYTSVLANCVVSGFPEALAKTKAKIVYVCNLMSKQGQTVGLQAAEHLAEVVRYCGVLPDVCVVNTENFPATLIQKYANEGNHPIVHNCIARGGLEIVAVPLLAKEEVRTASGDVLTRSLIRHDSALLAKVLVDLLP
jgi:uncharacterized cofD-like protein